MNTSQESQPQNLSEIEIIQLKLDQQIDIYLRLAADFSNFKKRIERELLEQSDKGRNSFIIDLLPIVDNLKRALHCPKSDVDTLKKGIEITDIQITQLLQNNYIETFDCINLPFDPKFHDAIAVRSDSNYADNIVLEIIQTGYRCGDKILRPAKVIVNINNWDLCL